MEIDPVDNGERHQPHHALGATMRSPAVAGMHTPVSLVSTCHDITNATEMLDAENTDDEEEYGGDDVDYGGEYEDYDDDYVQEDGVDGGMDPEMVDGFLNGEEDRKFKSTVWNEFIKIRVAGVVVKGQRKHCEALITARRGVGTSAM